MNTNLVSIIIPVYNSEKHIERAIKSVLEQTYKNIELIIVNDGSTDNTKNYIMKLKKDDSRIKYFENINSGVSFARNIGLNNSTGKYIGFVDADDYIENNMIELLVNTAEKYTCDIVSCIYERVYPDIIIPEIPKIREGYYNIQDFNDIIYPHLFGSKYLDTIIPLNIVTKLFKRKIIEDNSIRFETDLKFGEDLLFTQKYFLYSNTFYFLAEEKLYKYTYNKQSATNMYSDNKWNNRKLGFYTRKEFIKKFPQYELKKQLPYAILRDSINAINNAGKNIDANKTQRLNELAQIVKDKDLQQALAVIDYTDFSYKNKIIFELIRRKKIYLIYIIQKYFNKLQ